MRRKINTGSMILDLRTETVGNVPHYYLTYTDVSTEESMLIAANDDIEKINAAWNRQIKLDRGGAK